jgi:hypothetical protein
VQIRADLFRIAPPVKAASVSWSMGLQAQGKPCASSPETMRRVVFMSAFSRDATRHPSGDGFLAEPFTIESLTGIVEEALSY